MTDVEKFWFALAPKFGDTRQWHDLSRMEQVQFIEGINMIFGVLKPQGETGA